MRAGVFMARDGLARLRRQIAEIEGRPMEIFGVGADREIPSQPSLSSFRRKPESIDVPAPLVAGDMGPGFRRGDEEGAQAPQGSPREEGASYPPQTFLLPEARASPLAPRRGGSVLPFGVPELDRLLAGGLRRNALHEVRSETTRAAGAATGFSLAILARLAAADDRPILWVVEASVGREAGLPYGPGLDRLGLPASRIVVVRVRRPSEALWVFEEGLACRGLAAVLAELRGHPRRLDLTASRRLALRARDSGVMGLLLRQAAAAEPSAALTRWQAAPHPAGTLDDFEAGIGRPAFRLALERNRLGMTGSFDLEWHHDTRSFALAADHPALSRPRACPVFRPTGSRGQTRGRSWRSEPRPHPPRAVVAKVKSALRLVALDETAERLGLAIGQALADARAMIPALDIVDEDASADLALLETVADWAERYTPLVALDPPHGLMLDITGAAHLFGGEAALLADLLARLAGQGFSAKAAIADTPGAASAAARFGGAPVVAPGEAAAMLAPLPLAALRLDPETVSALERVGLKRIGQVLEAPRAPLAARFGTDFIHRIDQALGREEEAISPRRPIAPLIAERRFAEPITREEDIAASLASLAATLARSLESRGEGARLLELALFRVDGAVSRTVVGAGRPVRAPKLVSDLFREKFAGLGEEIDAGFGFDMVRLAVRQSAPVDPAQIDLAGDAVGEADLDGLIDRIGARLGPTRVSRIVPEESHVPERAAVFASGGRTLELPPSGPCHAGGLRLVLHPHRPPAPPLCPARAGRGDRRGAGWAAGPFPLAPRLL